MVTRGFYCLIGLRGVAGGGITPLTGTTSGTLNPHHIVDLMLLVILGAGASYDSAPSKPPLESRYRDLPNRPPLADQLFGDRPYFGQVMQKYPNCLDIAPRLRHLQDGVSIESVLQFLQSEATEYPGRLQQLTAVRYYLQEILTICPNQWIHESHSMFNHRTLLDDIRRWHKKEKRVCFVTFNYDLIMDSALNYAGFPLADLSQYISREFMLIKLHGSVNWGRIVISPLPEAVLREPRFMASELIRQSGNTDISRVYVMAGGTPPSSQNNQGIFPALAIPVESKLEFECPPDHVDALKALLPHLTKILIIGWRATEEPFLELLKNGLGSVTLQIMVINGSRTHSENATKNIERAGISARYTIHEPAEYGFTEFIRNHGDKDFLSS